MQFLYTAYLSTPHRDAATVQKALASRFHIRTFDDLGDDRVMFQAVIEPEKDCELTTSDVLSNAAALVGDALGPHYTIDNAEAEPLKEDPPKDPPTLPPTDPPGANA